MRIATSLIFVVLAMTLAQAKTSGRCVQAFNVHSTYGDGYADGFEAVVNGHLRTISPQHVKYKGRTESRMCGRTLYLSTHMVDW